MKRIPRSEARVYGLDGSLRPALNVAIAEPFLVETEDASSGIMASGAVDPSPENMPYAAFNPPRSNPVAGPIYVEGVKAGDRVRIEIVSIDPAPAGAVWNREGTSPLADSRRWEGLSGRFAHTISHRDGYAVLSDRLKWPLRPMIGTLACAPEWEVHSTSTGQGPWGGNLDVPDFAPSSAVYLNAYHDGALLFIGDVHGCQGDGEYATSADETRADVIVSVSVAPGGHRPWPRVETADRIVALGLGRPLENATNRAAEHLMSWLVEEFGFSQREAYLTVGLNPDFRFRVYQFTPFDALSYVVGASLPKSYITA
jgi:acetamidase/formamidase